MKNPIFMHLCWFLTDIGFVKISGALRRLVWNMSRDVKYTAYGDPVAVGGYKGWYEISGFGVVGFQTMTNSIQFDW